MSCVQLSDGGFQVVWLVVPLIRSCQSPIWIWLVNHLHLHLHLHACCNSCNAWQCMADQEPRA